MTTLSDHWKKYYLPPEIKVWQGRDDSPKDAALFQVIHMLNLIKDIQIQDAKQPLFALLGFCCDVGITRNLGRPGAAAGPHAIRPALASLATPPLTMRLYDAGNIMCVDDDLEAAQASLATAVNLLLQKQITPIVIGGGHEVALGTYTGATQSYAHDTQARSIGIINFDAHFDMRPMQIANQGSSGTPFLQIGEHLHKQKRPFDYTCLGIQPASNSYTLFANAEKYDVHYLLAEELHLHFDRSINAIDRAMTSNHTIYVSLCLDVFAQSYAPGVSAPQALGLTPWQVIPLLRQIAQSGKTICYDIAELSPPHDIDNRTIKLAANLVYEIITHHQ